MPPKDIKCFLTNHNPIGKDEELDIWGKGTEHQAACHHHTTEDGHGTSPKVVHTCTADRTWGRREKRQTGVEKRERGSQEVEKIQRGERWVTEEQKYWGTKDTDVLLLNLCLENKQSFWENQTPAYKALLRLTMIVPHHIRFKLATCQRRLHITQENLERLCVLTFYTYQLCE